MTGAIKPVAQYLFDNVDTLFLSSAYDSPFEDALYIATQAEVGLEVDSIVVALTILDNKLALQFNVDSGIANCGFSDITGHSGTRTFTLTDASFIYASGGDRVECVDADGVVLGDSRVISRSSNTIILQDDFTDVDVIRLKISQLGICIGTDPVKWIPYAFYKKAGDDYPLQFQVNIR